MTYSKEKMREYQRNWMAARRSEYFEDKFCVVCKSTERLELDHINPEDKKYSPAALWGMSNSNPNKISELEKCQVLCYTHHKEKSSEDAKKRRKHGRTMYTYGCRCDICKEAQRLHNAQRNAR